MTPVFNTYILFLFYSPICQDPEINAIVTVKDNTTYVFKDKLYYKLSDDSVADGYPR